MKFEINGHNGYRGKMVLCQATVMKILGIDDLNVVNERFPWLFQIRHNQYGRVNVKQSVAKGVGHTEAYRFVTENHKRNRKFNNRIECDTYFFLGFDLDWKNIEKTYIIPNQGQTKDIENVTICKNAYSSRYDEFKVDHVPYNDMLHNLKKFIKKDGNIVMVDTEDVKKWLKIYNN